MRIKRVELLGFKSFCDKASLDFEENITGVVGPNGCGKSNIVDALRWAMGEQSARHLRGKTMEDVIFNGSDSRGPSGVGEVCITFQNDGNVPIEYLNYHEIAIARRLHRDGTSEYLINKVPVRLRDITNLFLGTGVGTKAYSIIEQGRIGLIVSSRPEDRRHFIEEAAGITKYQRRKQAALRKIEATQQNLLRVGDVLDEMGKRLGSLRRQAQKAERYKRYRDEMRDIELWSSSHRLLGNIAEQKFQAAKLEQLESEREESLVILERQEVELEGTRLTAMEKERQVGIIQEELYSLDNRIKLNENNINFHGHEAEDLEQRAEDARSEVADLERQLQEAGIQYRDVEQESSRLSSVRKTLQEQLAERELVLTGIREDLGEVRTAAAGEREEVTQAERAGARTEASLRALLQRRHDIQDRLDRRREEINRVVDRIATLGSSAGDLDGELTGLRTTAEQLSKRRDDAKARLEVLTEQAQRGEAEIEVLRTELHRRRSRLASITEIQQRYEGFSRGTRAIMQKRDVDHNEKGIIGLVADMIEAPASYEAALEAVLGDRLGTIVVEDDEVGLNAIEYLKSSAEGRSSFIPRWTMRKGVLDRAPVGFTWQPPAEPVSDSSGPAMADGQLYQCEGVHGPMLNLIHFNHDYHQVAESLLQDVIVVENLEQALELWETTEEKTLVTLDGEILHPEGTLTGGSREAEQSGFLRQKREIKELGEIITDLEQQYRLKLDDHVSVKTEIASLEQVLEEATREGHQGDKDILTREKDLSRIASEREAMEARMAELEAEMEQLRQLLDEMEAQETQLKADLIRAAEEEHLAGDMVYLLTREERRLDRMAEEAAAGVTDVRVELADAEATCRSVDDNLRRIEEMQHEKTDRIKRLETSAQEGAARAVQLRKQVEEMQDELADLVTRRADAQERMSGAKEQYDADLAKVGELEVQLKAVRNNVSRLGVDVGKLQLKVSELAMAKQHLEEQIWERFREDLTAVAGDYHLRPAVSEEARDRLDKLRQLIDRMGEINLTAIDEFDELDDRFQFLSTHRKDLESALNQLQRAIQRINRISRKRFMETFELVNTKFKEVFPRLFNGGRAKLQLSDPENLLESGVDIIAQPPGKRLQSIDLLSGGEKALTAVSLIFAMFLVKPTPFCLLDEVDAPLDEANVTRFNEMVREMSSNSQFILITHNRRTMEIVDRLYGVTMEDPGISKLVSVNLSQVEEAA